MCAFSPVTLLIHTMNPTTASVGTAYVHIIFVYGMHYICISVCTMCIHHICIHDDDERASKWGLQTYIYTLLNLRIFITGQIKENLNQGFSRYTGGK